MILTCHAGEDSSESLGLQGDPSQSFLKEINPEYSLEGWMLKLQYFDHLMGKTKSLEKTEDWRQKKKAWADEMVRDG